MTRRSFLGRLGSLPMALHAGFGATVVSPFVVTKIARVDLPGIPIMWRFSRAGREIAILFHGGAKMTKTWWRVVLSAFERAEKR